MMNHTQAIYNAQIVFEEALSDKETIDKLLHIALTTIRVNALFKQWD